MSVENTPNDTVVTEEAKKAAELEAAVRNMTEELKELRQKKQEAEAERDLLKAKGQAPANDDVESKVRKVLDEERTKTVGEIRKSAEEKFRSANKEFHPDNDPGGVKWAAFEKKLARINTAGLVKEEDFLAAYDDALLILTRKPAEPTVVQNPYASTPSGTGGSPRTTDPNNLSTKEHKLLKQMGWTEEQYLKHKKSRPSYVAKLLEYEPN